jgi:hypothetical protein
MTTVSLPAWVSWVSALAPAVTATVALVAALVALFTLRQRTRADARQHWWERTKWAIERAQSSDAGVARVGMKILALQATSELARREEVAIMDAVYVPIVTHVEDRAEPGTDGGVEYVVEEVSEHDNEGEGGGGHVGRSEA